MNIGLILLLTVIILVATMIGSCYYFSFWMQKSTFNRVNDLDEVRSTELPPERWQKHYVKRCRRLNTIPPTLYIRQKRKDLRQLQRLVRFVKTTKLVESEEVRKSVLTELSHIRQEWESEERGETLTERGI